MPRSNALMDVAAIKESIAHSGEFRVHLITSQAGTGVTARMWHWDGFKVGHAGGGGYDRRGAALGQAVELFFAEELKALPLPGLWGGMRTGLYGLSEHKGRRSVDGSCGIECVLKILGALGFSSVELYETGNRSSMVLARK